MSARTVTFPSVASPRTTLFPLRRGPGRSVLPGRQRRRHLADEPAAQRVGHGAHHPRGGQRGGLHGMGKRRRRIPRRPAGDARRRRRSVGFRAGQPDRRRCASASPAPATRAHRPSAGGVDPGDPRAAGAGQGRVPRLASAGDQVRHAGTGTRTRSDAGAAARPRCGGTSRRGSFTAPTSIRDGPAPSSAVLSGRRRWNGSRRGRPNRPARR